MEILEQQKKSLNRVLEYIEDNLTTDLPLEKLASVGAISKYYFHRLFKDFTGEPLSEYIKRRRLSYAAYQLVETSKKIEEIGFEITYKSIEAFTRAFKKQFMCPPAEYRKRNIYFTSEMTPPFNLSNYTKQASNYKEISFQGIQLIGFSQKGFQTAKRNSLDPDFVDKHDEFWNTLYKHNYPIKNAITYGLHKTTLRRDDAKESFYREWEHFIGVPLISGRRLPGLEIASIPAGNCLHYKYKGIHAECNSYVGWLYDKHISNLSYNINHDYNFTYEKADMQSDILDENGYLIYEKLFDYWNESEREEWDYLSPDYEMNLFIPYE